MANAEYYDHKWHEHIAIVMKCDIRRHVLSMPNQAANVQDKSAHSQLASTCVKPNAKPFESSSLFDSFSKNQFLFSFQAVNSNSLEANMGSLRRLCCTK